MNKDEAMLSLALGPRRASEKLAKRGSGSEVDQHAHRGLWPVRLVSYPWQAARAVCKERLV